MHTLNHRISVSVESPIDIDVSDEDVIFRPFSVPERRHYLVSPM